MSAFVDGLPFELSSSGATLWLDAEVAMDRVGVLAAVIDIVAGRLAVGALTPRWAATRDLVIAFSSNVPDGPLEVSGQVRDLGRGRVLTYLVVASNNEIVASAEVGLVVQAGVVPALHSQQRSPRNLSVADEWLPVSGPLTVDERHIHAGGIAEGGLLAMYAARSSGLSRLPRTTALRFLTPGRIGRIDATATDSGGCRVELSQTSPEGVGTVMSAWFV